MRILLVTNYQPPHMGGIEFAGEALKACWERDGHRVTWLSTNLPRGSRAETPDNLRVTAANQAEDWLQINTPLVSPLAFPRIRQAICNNDVVNTHSLAPGLSMLALKMAQRMDKPAVATQHVGIIPLRWKWLSHLQESVIIRNARQAVSKGAPLTFVGAAVRDWFIEHSGLRADQTCMTPAGIDPAAYHFVDEAERSALRSKWNLADGKLNALFVGRFYDKKGLPLIHEVASANPDIYFTLVGSGPIKPDSWRLPNIRLVGFVSTAELRELYGAHDLFIMPSFGEGWPAVVPQAMACGLPCLISEECFQGYAKEPERFLISRRTFQDVDAILKAATGGHLELLNQRRAISDFARTAWDWQRTARQYIELFDRAIRRK